MIIVASQPLDPAVRQMKAAVLDCLQATHDILEVDSLEALAVACDRGLVGLSSAHTLFFGSASSPLALAITARLGLSDDLIVLPQPEAWVALFADLPALTRIARRLHPDWQPMGEA